MLDVDYDMYLFGMRAYKVCRKKDDETTMEMEMDKGERSVDQVLSGRIFLPDIFLQMFMVDPEEGALYTCICIYTYMYVYMHKNRQIHMVQHISHQC